MRPTPQPVALGLGTRAGMRLRHGARLARAVGRYAADQRIWWLIPAITVIALAALAVTTTTSALPVAVYALF